jgi:Ankyrin repeat
LSLLLLSIIVLVQDGRTPLHVACRSGQDQIIDMLLEAKADVNAETKVCELCVPVSCQFAIKSQ